MLGKALARECHDVCLEAGVHVVLNVDCVLLADLHKHPDVVLVVRVFLLVRVQQMFVLFEVFYNFAVDSLVLKCAVQNDKHLRRDGPVVQVRDMPLEDEFHGTKGSNFILVLAVETL